jgi:hypothetical protein
MKVPRETETKSSHAEALSLPEQIRIKAQGIRPQVRTVREALGLIDDELPAELRSLSRWTFARALLLEAEKSRKKRDLTQAARQLKQALENEGWLPAKDAQTTSGSEGS